MKGLEARGGLDFSRTAPVTGLDALDGSESFIFPVKPHFCFRSTAAMLIHRKGQILE